MTLPSTVSPSPSPSHASPNPPHLRPRRLTTPFSLLLLPVSCLTFVIRSASIQYTLPCLASSRATPFSCFLLPSHSLFLVLCVCVCLCLRGLVLFFFFSCASYPIDSPKPPHPPFLSASLPFPLVFFCCCVSRVVVPVSWFAHAHPLLFLRFVVLLRFPDTPNSPFPLVACSLVRASASPSSGSFASPLSFLVSRQCLFLPFFSSFSVTCLRVTPPPSRAAP